MSLSFWEFIKRLLRSHLAHVLLAVSWCFILFVMVRPPMDEPMFAGCIPTQDEIHLHVLVTYPIWVVAIGAAHFPSMLLTQVVSRSFQGVFALSCAPIAKLQLAIFFVFSTVQWFLVGHGIESLIRWIKSRKNQRRSQQALAADSPMSGI